MTSAQKCVSSFLLILCSGCGTYRPVNLQSDAPSRLVPANVVNLLAEQAIGKKWALPVSSGTWDIMQSRWLVLILRRDCEHCRKLFNEFFVENHELDNYNLSILIADGSSWKVFVGSPRMSGKEDASILWPEGTEPFVASPAAFILLDGVVASAADGERSAEFLANLSGTQ